jgi:hypothetical protein
MYSGIHGSYIIEGYFSKGQATGYCRWIWNDGTCYTGTLKDFQTNGKGIKILGKCFKNIV